MSLLWRLDVEMRRGAEFPERLERRTSRTSGVLLFGLAIVAIVSRNLPPIFTACLRQQADPARSSASSRCCRRTGGKARLWRSFLRHKALLHPLRLPTSGFLNRTSREDIEMEPIKFTLCPLCTECPGVEITDEGVRIGEDANTVRLSHAEWNELVALIKRGDLHEV